MTNELIRNEWTCNYCIENFHEACEDILLSNYGVYKCKCVCNNEGMFGK